MSDGFAVWFTGLSGSGKSTLTSLLAARIRAHGVHVEVLDGDEVRTHLSKGLGFSREDRDTNIRRIGFVAKLLVRAGACVMTASISPYRETRDEQRRKIGRFVEVYLKCSIPVLTERDPKGLYKKALAGEIVNFTGIDDPYEEPEHPEVTIGHQPEYGTRSMHTLVEARISRLLGNREFAKFSIDTRLDENRTGFRTASEVQAAIARMDFVVTTRLHGLVLALKNGVPAVPIDPIAGGAKVSRQVETIGWPICFVADCLDDERLNSAFDYCLTEVARQEAFRCTETGCSSRGDASRRSRLSSDPHRFVDVESEANQPHTAQHLRGQTHEYRQDTR